MIGAQHSARGHSHSAAAKDGAAAAVGAARQGARLHRGAAAVAVGPAELEHTATGVDLQGTSAAERAGQREAGRVEHQGACAGEGVNGVALGLARAGRHAAARTGCAAPVARHHQARCTRARR